MVRGCLKYQVSAFAVTSGSAECNGYDIYNTNNKYLPLPRE